MARKGDANQHRIIGHVQTGGDARGDWNDALEKASREFALNELEQIRGLYQIQQAIPLEVRNLASDWIYLGAKDFAWKQLEQKYPEPSKFQSFVAQLGSIPILNSIPIVKGLTALAGIGSSLLHI